MIRRATTKKNPSAVNQILLTIGCKGLNALMIATQKGHIDVVRLLLNYDANIVDKKIERSNSTDSRSIIDTGNVVRDGRKEKMGMLVCTGNAS
jgi:ankyrin repeat protein